jgi:hypothetical protein
MRELDRGLGVEEEMDIMYERQRIREGESNTQLLSLGVNLGGEP